MPTKAPTICSEAGCPAVIPSGSGGRCAQHRRPNPLHHKASSTQRGYGYAYQQERARVLAAHPVCQICHQEPSRQAHHVTKARDGGGARDNLVAVGLICHGRLTARGK